MRASLGISFSRSSLPTPILWVCVCVGGENECVCYVKLPFSILYSLLCKDLLKHPCLVFKWGEFEWWVACMEGLVGLSSPTPFQSWFYMMCLFSSVVPAAHASDLTQKSHLTRLSLFLWPLCFMNAVNCLYEWKIKSSLYTSNCSEIKNLYFFFSS